MLGAGVDKLGAKLDQLSSRVGRLSQQLATETAACRLSRWASRHPPKSEFLREIAEGGTGTVHEVSVDHGILGPGTRVAVKRVDWSTHEQRKSVAKRVATEISVLQSMKHPLLPTLHQVYTTGDEIFMEMTLCSRGTLWHEQQELGGKMPLELVRQYAAELVCVLSHLHENGIVYVDLKPENVLVQDCGHIMLCDMDLVHTQQEITRIQQLEAVSPGAAGGTTWWGTLEFVAPEVASNGAVAYSPASDWWGLGVLIYNLLLGLTPWDGETYDATLAQIQTGDVLWPPEGMLHPEAEDLLRGLLTYDPQQRLGNRGVHQIQQHPFFASVHWSSLLAEVERDQQLHAEVQARLLQEQREQQQRQQQQGERQQQQPRQLEPPATGRWGLPVQDDERERVYSRQW
ncbi:hypothetical protein OEZ86_003835 [Tetradesmus obliquus]|nr:hypothetical protein OEZ86_003835 [Tetradesmus obliquus]